MTKKEQLKSEVNHTVTTFSDRVEVSKGYFGRYVSINKLFDIIEIGDQTFYEFKDGFQDTYWFDNKTLENLYKYNSIFMNFHFKSKDIPKRCVPRYEALVKDFINHLKSNGRKSVSTMKVKIIVKHIIKHISRLHYHKKVAIIFPKRKSSWVDHKQLSHEYCIEFIKYLVGRGVVKEFLGYLDGVSDDAKRYTTMLVFKPDFIKDCNGSLSTYTNMDSCLKPENTKPLVRINETYHKVIKGKEKKLKREKKLNREERSVAKRLEVLVKEYQELLSGSTIEINGVYVPEMFMARVFNENFTLGGRWFDDGSVQHQPKIIRQEAIIDGEPVVELDFKSLHYAFAGEELGISVLDKDPYNFPFDVQVDQDSIKEWEKRHNTVYQEDPIRNLKKVALLTLFNASSKESAIKGISKAIIDDYRKEDNLRRRLVGVKKVDAKLLIESVIKHNKVVEKYFNSGVGIRFQNLDSQIMTYCVSKFVEKMQVCIPVHDSLIIKESLKDFAKKTMEDAYLDVMGSNLNCKVV